MVVVGTIVFVVVGENAPLVEVVVLGCQSHLFDEVVSSNYWSRLADRLE